MTQSQARTALNPTIGVLGLGHVGLPTALGFADLGWRVVGADDDRAKARAIARGEVPFYEPGLAALLARHLSGRLAYCGAPEEAARGAHALVIMTEWPGYRTLDLAGLRGVMALPILIDGRNALEPARVRSLGFQYQGMGR